MRRAAAHLATLVSLIAPFAASPVLAAGSGTISGRVMLVAAGSNPSPARNVAVYLEPLDPSFEYPSTAETVLIEQRDARFIPNFLVVEAGQAVSMPNADRFMHNVFSYSKPNDFDLGIYPEGESKELVLEHPGIVRIYCSIHSSMRAVIVVSPTPFFDTSDASGSFDIRDVPPGDYRVRTFNEPLPPASMEVRVDPGQSQTIEIEIGGT